MVTFMNVLQVFRKVVESLDTSSPWPSLLDCTRRFVQYKRTPALIKSSFQDTISAIIPIVKLCRELMTFNKAEKIMIPFYLLHPKKEKSIKIRYLKM